MANKKTIIREAIWSRKGYIGLHYVANYFNERDLACFSRFRLLSRAYAGHSNCDIISAEFKGEYMDEPEKILLIGHWNGPSAVEFDFTYRC